MSDEKAEVDEAVRRFVEKAMKRCRVGTVGSVEIDLGGGRFRITEDGVSALPPAPPRPPGPTTKG